MNAVVTELREKIDAKHAEAIHALETIQKYLDESTPIKQSYGMPLQKRDNRPGEVSIRDKVLGIIGREWATVSEIVSRTDLTTKQVRGVLNSQLLADQIDRRDIEGKREYRLKPESSPQ